MGGGVDVDRCRGDRADMRFFRLLLAVLVCTPALSMPACGGSTAAREPTARCDRELGDDPVGRRVAAFVAAQDAVARRGTELAATLAETCSAMGDALGVERGSHTPGHARAVCEPVIQAIRLNMTELVAGSDLRIEIATVAPICEVAVDGFARCAAKCDGNFDAEQAAFDCEGGELRGTCGAECSGRCAASVEGNCGGACEGTCDGSCTGVCLGACDGECTIVGQDGQCNGVCRGRCQGACSAICSGACSGPCVVGGRLACDGECRGSCSEAFGAPRCTGGIATSSLSPACQAACDASVEAAAACGPATIQVAVTGEATADASDRAGRLRAAIEGNWSRVLTVSASLRKLHEASRGLDQAAALVPGGGTSPPDARAPSARTEECFDGARQSLRNTTHALEEAVSVAASLAAAIG